MKNKYLVDEVRKGRYIRAWREGRGRNAEIVVQVWDTAEPIGESQHEWGMPPILGVELSIEQSILQSPIKVKEENGTEVG